MSEKQSQWEMLQERALFDPFVQALVARVRQGESREEALMACVTELSAAREALERYSVELLQQMPARLHVKG